MPSLGPIPCKRTQTQDTNTHAQTEASPHTNTKKTKKHYHYRGTAVNDKLGYYKPVWEIKEEMCKGSKMTSLLDINGETNFYSGLESSQHCSLGQHIQTKEKVKQFLSEKTTKYSVFTGTKKWWWTYQDKLDVYHKSPLTFWPIFQHRLHLDNFGSVVNQKPGQNLASRMFSA